MGVEYYLNLSRLIIVFGVILQTVEYLILKESFQENGVWDWSKIKKDFYFLPNPLQRLFDYALRDKHFILLLWIRLIAAISLIYFVNFPLFLYLFLSSFLISLRFRGSFNGGSDYMTLIVLSALSLQSLSVNPLVWKGILWYLALQSITSYFLAGVVKIKTSSWKNGNAIRNFMQSPNYRPPQIFKKWLSKKIVSFISGWTIILFEMTFPLILIQSKNTARFWLLGGFLFHFINFFIFGLNRFLIVWLSTYPAIYFCTK